MGFLNAQQSKTLTFDSIVGSPSVQIEKLSWIAGSWQGEAFGAKTEEVWNPPSGGSMMGMFKLYSDNEVMFYELMTIRQTGTTILMQLKHFNNDLSGWEEQNETVDFKLVKVEEGIVYFDGLTFERVSENEMNVYVVIGDDDGCVKEEKFAYTLK
jgi:hypothetical protein